MAGVDPTVTPTEKQIVDRAINDIVMPDLTPTPPVDEEEASEVAGKPAQKPTVGFSPRIADVPDWMVIRQPR